MDEAGLFPPDLRLEMLGGEIFDVPPIGSRHAATVRRLNRHFVLPLGDRAVVSVRNPVRLSNVSEPEPDLTLLRCRPVLATIDLFCLSTAQPNGVRPERSDVAIATSMPTRPTLHSVRCSAAACGSARNGQAGKAATFMERKLTCSSHLAPSEWNGSW
jgi:hypothetical protein